MVGSGSHRIESMPPAAFVHSETTPVELVPLEGTIQAVLNDRAQLITRGLLGEWIDTLVDTADRISPQALGQMFRGFGALWLRS